MDWSHFANPLDPNPRVKKWVKELLGQRPEIGKAIGSPLGEMLGCGHWGCVVDSSGPLVVKLTIDPNEAPIWEKIIELAAEEAWGEEGVVRVKGLFRLEPGVMYGGRSRKVYAIVREAVDPVFEGDWRLSMRTVQELGLPVSVWPVSYVPSYGSGLGHLVGAEFEIPSEQESVRQFLSTMKALSFYQDAARKWFGGQRDFDRIERITYAMDGWVGNAMGETLRMLLGNEVVLRDVHFGNIGWRVRSTIDGVTMQKTICIFDPGHTPAGRDVRAPVVRYGNPWGY